MIMTVSSRYAGPARRCGFDARGHAVRLSPHFKQLGLKLNTTKAPANVLVIDNVSKPSEN
jgi:uncharacterized protein (TIGR03435 family)